MSIGLIIGAMVLLGLGFGVKIYNDLVALKNNVAMSWANIDVLLVQRHDELPKLVDACRRYMGYEQQTLAQVMEARGKVMMARDQGDIKALSTAEGELRAGLGQLFALAENYPDLKTSQTFLHLQDRISGLESSIADRRELYNDSVNRNNIRIRQFPDVIVAVLLAFKRYDLLVFAKEDIANVSIRDLFA